MRVETEE